MTHVLGIHAGFSQCTKQELGIGIGTHRSKHVNSGANTCRSSSLVAGFAAGQHLQRAAGDSLPRSRQTLGDHGVIGIHRTDDANRALDSIKCRKNVRCCHSISFRCR